MTESILEILVSAAVTILTVLLSSKGTRDKLSQEMHEDIAVVKNDMQHMSERIDEHNGYAKMFAENIPAIKQHMLDVDRRLESLERKD